MAVNETYVTYAIKSLFSQSKFKSRAIENGSYGLTGLFLLSRRGASIVKHHAEGSGRLISLKSESTTVAMITLFLFGATLSSFVALLVMAIAALCRIGQNHLASCLINKRSLYRRSWILSAIFLIAAYFGYGLFSLPVIMGIGRFSLKLTLRQTLLFSVLTGVLLICLNILLALAILYLGGYLGGGMILLHKLST